MAKQEWKDMTLWGYHPAYCDEPIRICESPSKKYYKERESAGWLLSVELPGREPDTFRDEVRQIRKGKQ